jgi:hypothetical protein
MNLEELLDRARSLECSLWAYAQEENWAGRTPLGAAIEALAKALEDGVTRVSMLASLPEQSRFERLDLERDALCMRLEAERLTEDYSAAKPI